jgi:nucleoside-diphosphate-sugar epimerase
MRILVTGSNGYIGRHLKRRFSTFSEVVEFDLALGNDIFSLEQLTAAMKDCDLVINLAAIGDIYEVVKNPSESYRVNVEGAVLVGECCLGNKIPLVHISTCCVYGNQSVDTIDENTKPEPTEPYARMKFESEKILLEMRTQGLRVIIVRLATCYGGEMRPTQVVRRFLDQCLNNQPITIHGTGKQARTFTHIDDIITGLGAIAKNPIWNVPVLNLSTETQIDITTLALTISKLCGKKVDIKHIGQRSGQIYNQQISSKLIAETYGWQPRIGLEAGLRDTIKKYGIQPVLPSTHLSSMESAIVITGCSGLIGSLMSKKILENGGKVIGIDLVKPPISISQFEQFFFINRDVRYVKDVSSIIEDDIEGFIHLASPSRVLWVEEQPNVCIDIMINGTQNMLEEAAKSNANWFIFGSSREVYGDSIEIPVTEECSIAPVNVYGKNKVAAEEIVCSFHSEKRLPIRKAILRYSNVYGSWHDHHDRVVPAFVKSAITGECIEIHGNDRMFDFTHVEDVVKATMNAIDCLRRKSDMICCHITTGRGTTLEELANLAMSATGNSCTVRYSEPRTNDPSKFVGDNDRCRELLGIVPEIGIENGINRLVEMWDGQTIGIQQPPWRVDKLGGKE